MRKFFIAIISSVLVSGVAFAIDWHVADQGTFKWLPVTTMDNGEKLPDNAVIRYEVYLKNIDLQKVELVGEVNELQTTVTFSLEGQHITGIKAIRYLDGNVVSRSKQISWSDNPEYSPAPFGFTYYRSPAQTDGMEKNGNQN